MSEPLTKLKWEYGPETGEITCMGAALASVRSPDDFPCLDLDEHDFEALREEYHAVGRLMVAAPELLAECEETLKCLVVMDAADGAWAVRLRALIAKVLGP